MKDNNNIYPNNCSLSCVEQEIPSKSCPPSPFFSNTSGEAKLIRLCLVFSTWKLQSVWIPDETLFQVFDLASERLNIIVREIQAKVCQIL